MSQDPGKTFEAQYTEAVAKTATDDWDGRGAKALPKEHWEKHALAPVRRVQQEVPQMLQTLGKICLIPTYIEITIVWEDPNDMGCAFSLNILPNGITYWLYTLKGTEGHGGGNTDALIAQLKFLFPVPVRKTFQENYLELVRDTAEDNWDDDGGKPIPQAHWESRALALVTRVKQDLPHLPDPHPSAAGDGTMCLRWCTDDWTFDAEFVPESRLSWSYLKDKAKPHEKGNRGSGESALESFDQLIAEMKLVLPAPYSFRKQYERMVRYTAKDGWDHSRPQKQGSGKAIRRAYWEHTALALFDRVKLDLPHLPDPFPSADDSGVIYMRWSCGKNQIDVELYAELGKAEALSWSIRTRASGKPRYTTREGSTVQLIEEMRELFPASISDPPVPQHPQGET